MGLPRANRPDEEDVFRSPDPLPAGEFQELGAVEPLGGRDVEGVEGLELREAGGLQAQADPGGGAGGDFGCERLVEVLLHRPALLTGLARERLEAARETRHLQGPRVRAHELGGDGGAAHGSAPSRVS